MIHRDKWFEAFILLHLKPLASCGSLGLSLACIVYIDNNILLHLKPLASCGSLVCKFEVSRPFQSYLLTVWASADTVLEESPYDFNGIKVG